MPWLRPDPARQTAEQLYAALVAQARCPEFYSALRVPDTLDGRFELVRARSVPRQSPPYRPLTEVVLEQHVFELTEVEGTMLGFRFPDYAEGIEVSGYHLHFLSDDRRRGGHVLASRCAAALRARLDPSNDLHVELPPGVELADPGVAAETHAAVELVERGS